MDVAVDVDHLMLGVSDLDAAGASFERLGFTVTARSEHTVMGTANRCVMLTSGSPDIANYVELMAVTGRDRLPQRLTEVLGGPEGVKAVVLATRDANASATALAARGLGTAAVFSFDRMIELPDGDEAMLAFTVAMLPSSAAPVPTIVCAHHTLATLTQREWQHHVNGAQRLTGCMIVATAPAAVAARLEQLLGVAAHVEPDGGRAVRCGQVTLRIVTPDVLRRVYPGLELDPARPLPYVLGLAVAVTEIRQTEDHLRRAGVPCVVSTAGTAVSVMPQHAHGALLEFERAVPRLRGGRL